MARKLEQYTPLLRETGELRTGLPTVLESTLASGTQTITGNMSVSGTSTFTGAVTLTTGATGPQTRLTSSSAAVGATVVLTAADSGKVLINASTSASPSWTLPAKANGLYFTFVCGNTTAGFTVTAADAVIHFKTSASGTVLTSTTTLTNTQGTAIVGDTISIVCDGTAWWMVAQSGIFAAS